MAGAGRIYVVPFDALTVTNDADQDIFEFVNASSSIVYLHGFSLSSSTTTDERVRLRLVRRSTTGSGGSASTEVPLEDGNTMAAACAVSTLVTAPGTIGDILKGWQWSQQGELLYLPTPELRPSVSVSARLGLNLQTAVASSRTWSGWVAWEELA
jgi:hypothetical protein